MYYTGPSGSSVKSSYRPTPKPAPSPATSYLGYVPPNSAKPVPASSYQARQVSTPVARNDYITPAYNALGNIPIVSAAKGLVNSGKLSPPGRGAFSFSTPSRGGSTSGRVDYSTTSSSYPGISGSFSATSLDYLNAELAKHYGMDQATAYNEALANTSYQRAVRDMQAAGLNPAVLFGNGRVSGADGVYGATPLSAASGVSYGFSGGSSGGYSRSGRSPSSKLFSRNAYGMIAGLGGLAGAGIAAATGGSIGLGALTGTTIATSAAKVLNGIFR